MICGFSFEPDAVALLVLEDRIDTAKKTKDQLEVKRIRRIFNGVSWADIVTLKKNFPFHWHWNNPIAKQRKQLGI